MSESLFIAIIGGLFPALLWFLFWIREDRKHPEPLKLLILTFLGGMLAVVVALKLETIVFENVAGDIPRLIWWAIIEELSKFAFAYLIVLRRKEVDEPIDFVVYMITIALGFAALENIFFLLNSPSPGLSLHSLLTGNLRFIGATLLHIVASATVGIAMAFAFYKNRIHKWFYLCLGLILATVLHAGFNIAIIVSDGQNSLLASSAVWIAVIGILLLFEKVKKIHPSFT